MENIINDNESKKIGSKKVYKVYIEKGDYITAPVEPKYDNYTETKYGTYFFIPTSDSKRVPTNRHKLFSGRTIYKYVPVCKPVGVYATYDGDCFYEMITGKEMKVWDENNYICDYSKYVYYDHATPANPNEAVEEIQLVISSDENIHQYIQSLVVHEMHVRDARMAKQEETTAIKQYLDSYQRPHR